MATGHLTKQQRDVMDLLTVEGLSYREITRRTGVARDTIIDWIRGRTGQPFKDQYEDRLSLACADGLVNLKRRVEAAVDLIGDLAAGNIPLGPNSIGAAAIRLRAAQAVLNRVGLTELRETMSDDEARLLLLKVVGAQALED